MANQTEITTQPVHSDAVGLFNGQPVLMGLSMRNFIDDIVLKLNNQVFGNAVRIPQYLVADVPTPADTTASYLIQVTNETGGTVPAFWDGTKWRRVTDRAVVS